MDGQLFTRIAQAVQSSSLHGWLVIDRSFKIVFVNDTFCKLWQIDHDKLINKSLLEVLYNGEKKAEDDTYHGPLIETMDTGREFPLLEACLINPFDKSYIWYLASTFLLRDSNDEPQYAVGVYVPIDKFKVIEAKLDVINLSIIKAFCKAIGIRDSYTKQHSEHVAALMVELAEFLQLPRDGVTIAYLAGIVHDVGKIGVPERILNKPGSLTDNEYESVKRHAIKGADILSDIDGFEDIASIVRHHHERYDGLGYPLGLAGDAIPVYSRMLSVCDAYDAMTSARCYRAPYSVRQALDEIKRCSGTQFDPEISKAFIKFMEQSRIKSEDSNT
ncbi:MAG: HD domain-containing phosphohydrolase [Negativicutes bacterium]|jgi:putative nucleotidyltransferase with HDIG domain/PAS domain S-box-containing protein